MAKFGFLDVLEEVLEKGFTYEQDGALWFKSTELLYFNDLSKYFC